MAISSTYPTPINVNGYLCKNCTDVSLAKRHIDPAHPNDGPFGADTARQASRADAAAKAPSATVRPDGSGALLNLVA
jgi:hypothetical protein